MSNFHGSATSRENQTESKIVVKDRPWGNDSQKRNDTPQVLIEVSGALSTIVLRHRSFTGLLIRLQYTEYLGQLPSIASLG